MKEITITHKDIKGNDQEKVFDLQRVEKLVLNENSSDILGKNTDVLTIEWDSGSTSDYLEGQVEQIS